MILSNKNKFSLELQLFIISSCHIFIRFFIDLNL